MCHASSRYDSTLHFHRFPSDPTVKLQWIENITRNGRCPMKIIDSSIICSKHFTEDDYCNWTPVRKRLNKGAVPTVFAAPPEDGGPLSDMRPWPIRRARRRSRKLIESEASYNAERNDVSNLEKMQLNTSSSNSTCRPEVTDVHVSPYTVHPLPRQFVMNTCTSSDLGDATTMKDGNEAPNACNNEDIDTYVAGKLTHVTKVNDEDAKTRLCKTEDSDKCIANYLDGISKIKVKYAEANLCKNDVIDSRPEDNHGTDVTLHAREKYRDEYITQRSVTSCRRRDNCEEPTSVDFEQLRSAFTLKHEQKTESESNELELRKKKCLESHISKIWNKHELK
ncbi:uncharacterized protein LOC128209498 [Mya arenaria]|uniref:uncharacterized protein LOC128209498 n=1 Tax=Mya arenaria TaxID=6604 RepID=UPI0022E7EFAD|nr:uncharacterized protein LOC128209498 [Mya arenaria]